MHPRYAPLFVLLALAACSSPEPNTYLDDKPACDGPLMTFGPSRIVRSELQDKDWIEVSVTTLSYDGDGRLTRRFGPDENTLIEYFEGKIESITEMDGAGPWHKYTYDDDGRLEQIENLEMEGVAWKPKSRELFGYDDDGQLLTWQREHINDDGHSWSAKRDTVGEGIAYRFGDNGLIEQATDLSLDEFDAWNPSDELTRWTWTAQGRLAGVSTDWATGASGHDAFEYDGRERIVVSRFSDGKACVSDRSETAYEGDQLLRHTFDQNNACGETGKESRVEITYTTAGSSTFWELDPRPGDWLWQLYGSSLGACRE